MPRYFFDIDRGVEVADEVGRLLDGPDTIRAEAIRLVSAIVAAETEDESATSLVLSVRDESGTVRLRVRLVCQVEEGAQRSRFRPPSRAL